MIDIGRSSKAAVETSDFVAIGNLLYGIESVHSAFVIQFEGELFEFHYTGREIEYKEIVSDYFYKITDTIHKDEVPAFIAQCKHILKKANPIYGYFYSGEHYDLDGNHISSNSSGERMTCAGFCLNVFKGFLEDDYLKFEDWDSSTHESIGYLEYYCKQHGLDPKVLAASHRRITPRDCLISCFFSSLPIRKYQIDSLKPEVAAYFAKFVNDGL